MSLAIGVEVAAFVVGMLLGSFLNVCIARLPEHRSVVRPGSACMGCGRAIRWYDNVPVVSWVVLRGRCRDCGAGISWRYPAVELGVGLWFAYFAWKFVAFGNSSDWTDFQKPGPYVYNELQMIVSVLILGFLLIGLMVMDWRTHKLPDAFTLSGVLVAFMLICCRAVFLGPHEYDLLLKGRNPLTSPGNVVDRGNVILTGPEHLVLGRLLAICAAAGLVLLIRWLYLVVRRREGLGLGDAKLMAMIAGFLGFWPAMLALFVGTVLCSVYAVGLMARGKASAATRLPLGSFLCVGGLVAAVFGPGIIAWYSALL
jgi:leader peptidase (prepilin peptidase)/N-methyltransferase